MNDLISRKTLLEALVKAEEECEEAMTVPSFATAIYAIRNQPTVYDMDTVVEVLEEFKEDAEWDCEVALDDRHKEIAINREAALLQAIEIVKKGGVG